jgi:alkanesulfonate monooxygenase SsuD/methylene tetrahydromethanopterin reductase-like flavin-dependent oxidoreductase (luciferase family)
MKTDLLLIPMRTTYPAIRAAAIAAEAAGFDGIWTWDHLRATGGEGPTPEAWTVLTGIAERVRRVAVGPLVLNVINRHPAVLANMAATLQDVSGGRLILGLGAGGGRETPYATEQLAVGQPVEPDATRAERVAEAIAVIRRLWEGRGDDFTGQHYRLLRPGGYLRPSPPPPIVVGAFGPRMAEVAGRHGDGLNTQAMHPQLETMLRIAREAHAESARRDRPFLGTVFAGLAETWLRQGSRNRVALEGLGVDRLILLVNPPFREDTLQEAGALLSG